IAAASGAPSNTGTGWYGRESGSWSCSPSSIVLVSRRSASRSRTSSSSRSSSRSIVIMIVRRLSTTGSPLRSRIRPRGAGSGISRTAFPVARSWYSSAARTWRNHRRVTSAANANAITAARAVIRRRPSLISPPVHLLRARGLGHAAEERVRHRREDRVVHSGENRNATEEQRVAGQPPQKEGHEPVEQHATDRPHSDQDRGQGGARRGDELPHGPDHIAEYGEHQGGDALGVVQEEVLGHPGREPTDGPRGGTLQHRQHHRHEIHQLRLGAAQLDLGEDRRLEQQRRDDDRDPRQRASHRASLPGAVQVESASSGGGSGCWPVITPTVDSREKSTRGRTRTSSVRFDGSGSTLSTTPTWIEGGYTPPSPSSSE